MLTTLTSKTYSQSKWLRRQRFVK